MAHASTTPSATPTNREQLQRCFAAVVNEIDTFLTEGDEDKRESLREQLEPLCFMRLVEHRVQLAWGGPEYGFKLSYDPDARCWVYGVFYWADWFTYEEEGLSPEELDKVVEAYAMDGLV